MEGMYYIGKLEEFERILADRPLDEIWNDLLKLADFHYLRPRWKDHSEEDYTVVSTYIRQANEYYKASNNVSLLTKPVLTYYSFLNLLKAILYLKTDVHPSKYHGLGNFVTSDSLLDITIMSNDGIFSDLSKLIGCNINAKSKFSLEDFIFNTIELIPAYTEYFQKGTNIISPEVIIYTPGDIRIIFHTPMLLGKTREQFIEYLSNTTRILEDFEETLIKEHLELKLNYSMSYKSIKDVGIPLMKKHFIFSSFPDMSYYMNLNPFDKRINPALAYIGISFILCSIARYAPNHIDRFVSNKSTSVKWFFRHLSEITERVFPNLMLDILNDKNHKYASSFPF